MKFSSREFVLKRIRALYPKLKPFERRLADYFLSHSEEVLSLSITEISKETSTSPSSVVKFAQTLGFSGFQELKVAMANELKKPVEIFYSDISPNEDTQTIVQKVFEIHIKSLSETVYGLDPKDLELVANWFLNAKNIYWIGSGGSAGIVIDAVHKFLKIGLHVHGVIDAHVQMMAASTLKQNDLLIAVSISGSSKNICFAAELAKKNKAHTVAITCESNSPLSSICDVVLLGKVPKKLLGSDVNVGRMVILAIVDVLYAVLGLKRYEESMQYITCTRKATSEFKY